MPRELGFVRFYYSTPQCSESTPKSATVPATTLRCYSTLTVPCEERERKSIKEKERKKDSSSSSCPLHLANRPGANAAAALALGPGGQGKSIQFPRARERW